MYISHKSNVLQTFHDTEWQCRKNSKGLSKPEYWTWLATITSGDPPVVDYSGETGYTIVECTDEDVQARLSQLGDYVNSNRLPDEALVYNIKWSNSKVKCEEIKNIDGNSHSPKQYVQSHFKGDNKAKNSRILAEKWTVIRGQRDRLLTETDWVVIKAKEEHINTSIDEKWLDYRTALRDITKQADVDNITWPTKP